MPVPEKRTMKSYFPYWEETEVGEEYKTHGIYVGDVSASKNVHILVCPPVEVKVTTVSILVDTTVSTSDTNYWSAQLVNLTQIDNLLASAKTSKTTGGSAITADTPWDLTPDQTQYLRPNDVLELQLTKAASAATLSNLVIQVEYIITGEVATTTSTSTTTSTTSTSSSTSTSTTTT